MKRILFVCNNLNHGGIPKALVNLLKEIGGQYTVDLLLFYPEGDYLDEIPASVRLLPSEGWLPLLGTPQRGLKKQSLTRAGLRAAFVIWSRVFGNRLPRRIVFSTVPVLSGYDVAVSFAQDHSDKSFAIGCNDFVLRKVEASLKAAFVHCDFEQYGGNTPGNRASYRRFDRIACVSEGCRKAFLRVMPELECKTFVVGNCTDYASVRLLADGKPVNYLPACLNLVSVSRLNEEKGYFRALKAVGRVMGEYPLLHWYIVGDGPEKDKILAAVREAGLTDRITLLGAKDNPYPYMKHADLFFLPSLHEAAPMVFDEAKAVGVPVLTTDTLSAGQMVALPGTGIVCGNSENEIEQAVRRIAENPALLAPIRARLAEITRSNRVAIMQWERLIGAVK